MEEKFLLHVRSTCLHKESFTSLYYTVGIAEECAEFYQEMRKAEVDQKLAIVEVGGSLSVLENIFRTYRWVKICRTGKKCSECHYMH